MAISLTRFIDFVNLTGLKKRDVVANWLISGDYDPRADFYRQMREAIVKMHKNNEEISKLPQLISMYSYKKDKSYKELISGYQKWASNKKNILYKRGSQRV